MEADKDFRGNSDKVNRIKTDTNIPERFVIENFVIIEGTPPQDLLIEISIEVVAGKLRIWMEAPELDRLKEYLTEEIVKEQIELFKTDGATCLCVL